MTTEQFEKFIGEMIPQQLFHVDPNDIDDETGGKLDEVILVGLIADDLSCLEHKPLQWFVDTFLIKDELEQPTLKEEAEFGNHLQGQIEKQIIVELEQQFLEGDMISTDDLFQSSEEELFRQIQNDEREGEVCPDCMGSGEHVYGGSFGGATMHQPCFGCRGTGRIKN